MIRTRTVGASEAKAKFSELLSRVSQGVEFTITRHGKPVARLVPIVKPSRVELTGLFPWMDDFRARHPLNPSGMKKISYRELIEGGRKR
jgi:prevent-host-death family protein